MRCVQFFRVAHAIAFTVGASSSVGPRQRLSASNHSAWRRSGGPELRVKRKRRWSLSLSHVHSSYLVLSCTIHSKL